MGDAFSVHFYPLLIYTYTDEKENTKPVFTESESSEPQYLT